MSNNTALNSPLRLAISKDVSGAPKEIQPYLEDIFASFYQLQLALVQYCGIAPQDSSLWDELRPQDSILQQNMNRLYLEATEPIPAGALTHVFLSGGVLKARLANGTNNTKPCWAICDTEGGVATGVFGEFIFMQGLVTTISGLIPGNSYYLSTVSGVPSTVAAVAAGNIEQMVGVALDTTVLYFNSGPFIQH